MSLKSFHLTIRLQNLAHSENKKMMFSTYSYVMAMVLNFMRVYSHFQGHYGRCTQIHEGILAFLESI